MIQLPKNLASSVKRRFYFIHGLNASQTGSRKFIELQKILADIDETIEYLSWSPNDVNIVQTMLEKVLTTSNKDDQIIIISSSTGGNFSEQVSYELRTLGHFGTWQIMMNPAISVDILFDKNSELLTIPSLRSQLTNIVDVKESLIFLGRHDEILDVMKHKNQLSEVNHVVILEDDHKLTKTSMKNLFTDYILEYIYHNS